MTSKDQERKALEQIRKIVAGLGEESYIGRAFEGCFDRAADNIDNDFWNSPVETIANLRCKLQEAERRVDAANRELKLAKETMHQEAERANRLAESFRKANDKALEYANKAKEFCDNCTEQEEKVAALELENTKLKAKLYDMMVGA